ncbi:MAG: hypothetical protein Fur0044_46960 [Anaerolineae bacterium]|jgi:hypothetical protein|nr:hypothetical protein [Anaerolineales bacterium]MCQ3979723.1 hypothetical protein [Anaerolineae bacterium]
MVKVKGIYDGTKIVLLEPVSLLPNTLVEILIPEQEQLYWQQLLELGLIKEFRSQLLPGSEFVPVGVSGAPVSETIIKDRR